jgi:hypothetical protein
MTKQVQRRRGTATQHTSFTGAEGETSVNTTNKSIHVHDGTTTGGFEAARIDLTNVTGATVAGKVTGSTLSSLTITSADINGGTVDNVAIGNTTPSSGLFTTLNASSTLTLGGTAVTSTAAELNILDGVTATAAELNVLDGVTATAAELNLVDGSAAGSVVINKAVIYSATGQVNATQLAIGGTAITSTAAELNILDGVTSTAAELNILDGVTATAAELNFVDGVTSNVQTQLNTKAPLASPTFTGTVVATSLDISGDIDVDGTTNLDVVDIDGAVDMASTLLVTGVLTTTAATVFNGGFASNAASTIATTDNSVNLTLTSTDADASGGPKMNFYRNSASPAAGDVLTQIGHQGKNDAGETVSYMYQNWRAAAVGDGAESGQFDINTYTAGTAYERMGIDPTETVFNNDSADLNFRVASDTNANMLFVDGGNNRITIGGNDGTGSLTVKNVDSSGSDVHVHVQNTTANRIAGYKVLNEDGNAQIQLQYDNGNDLPYLMLAKQDQGNMSLSFDGSNANVASNSTSAVLNFKTSSTTRMSISVGGGITTTPLDDKHAVFNEGGVDANFRVESDNNANMLTVDGGADLVTVSGGSKVTNEVLRVNGAQVVGSGDAGVYTVGINQIFAASSAKYLRIQQDGSLFGGLTITATGDYSNVNAIGCFQKIYSIGANDSTTTLFGAGSVTVADLGETSGQFSMGTPTKPNGSTIYIPLTNLNQSYILAMSITVEFRGRIGGISAIDIIAQ